MNSSILDSQNVSNAVCCVTMSMYLFIRIKLRYPTVHMKITGLSYFIKSLCRLNVGPLSNYSRPWVTDYHVT